MSKKQLLEENTIRKFMKLANLEPLSDRFVKENLGYDESKEDELKEADEEEMDLDAGAEGGEESPMGDMEPADDMEAGADMGDEVDMGDEAGMDDEAGMGGEVSPEVAKRVVQAVLDALGVQGTVEDDEGDGDMEVDLDDESGEEDSEMDMDSEDSEEEPEEDGEEAEYESSDEEAEYESSDGEEDEYQEELEEGEDSEEVDESDHMNESLRRNRDQLVESVLRRVTARLVAEAKKSKKKPLAKGEKDAKEKDKKSVDVKKKMQEKKKKLDEKKHHMATHKKQVGGLAEKGKVKDKLYSKHEDMEYTEAKKGGKGGKGGHEMKPLKASGGHTKTHKKTSGVTSKGGNKHK